MCAVNVALHKPASASSVNNGGRPGNAVDGKTSTVHEGKKLVKESLYYGEKIPITFSSREEHYDKISFRGNLLSNFPLRLFKSIKVNELTLINLS